MSWSPSGGGGSFRSPGSSPESYRRRIDDFPRGRDDEFFARRTSPTFPRRIFKEVWTDTPNHRTFADRPRMFKRVFRPNEWSDEFGGEDEPHLRRVEREMDRDRDFDRHRFRHMPKEEEEEEKDFEGGRVHHIPIVVEQRRRPSDEPQHEDEWENDPPPRVHRLRKAFEERAGEDPFAHRAGLFSRREPTWDPAAARTLPTRKGHKASQSFDDSRHPVNPGKQVHRSHSETHEEPVKPTPSQPHSAAFRSHSDGHCPNQTFASKKETLKEEAPQGGPPSLGLQQIQAVLQTAEDLRKTVEAYSGSGRDKQYRFLDEMLTRCMLRLDDVDTEGREDVRSARKGAVREVQACIDRLEEKADEGHARKQTPKVIPLEDAKQQLPKVIPLKDAPKVIPLEDAKGPPKVIPLEGAIQTPPKVIPLGDVPGREPQVEVPKGDGEKKNGDTQKDEVDVQTKL